MLRTTCPLSSCQDHGLHQVIHGWDANESKWSAWAMYPLRFLICIAKVGQFSKHSSARSRQEQTTPRHRMQPARREGGGSGSCSPGRCSKQACQGVAMRQVLLEALTAACHEKMGWAGTKRAQVLIQRSASADTGSLYSAGYCRHTGVTEQHREDLKNTTSDDIHLYFPKLEKTVHPSLENKTKQKKSMQRFGNENWWTLAEWQTTREPCTISYTCFKQQKNYSDFLTKGLWNVSFKTISVNTVHCKFIYTWGHVYIDIYVYKYMQSHCTE